MANEIRCAICGRVIDQGYVVEGGLAYCCSLDCLAELTEAEGLIDPDVFWTDFEED